MRPFRAGRPAGARRRGSLLPFIRVPDGFKFIAKP
jgi:hypothetical protein